MAVRQANRSLAGSMTKALLLSGVCWLLYSPVVVVSAEADLLAGVPTSAQPVPGKLSSEDERKADAMACFVRAILEEESVGPDKALDSYRKTLQLDPGNSDLALRLSQDYMRRGDTVEAIAVLKDSLKARPKEANLAIALSLIYLRHLEKPDLAVRYANMALSAAPLRIEPYEAMVEIHMTQGQRSKALAMLDRAASAGSKDPNFWISLAELTGRLSQGGSTPVAETEAGKKLAAHLSKAVELANGDAVVLSRAGDLYAISQDVPMAVETYRQAYDLKASIPQLRHKLAAGYVELGRTGEAIQMLEEIVELNPLDLNAYDKLSQLHLRNGDVSKAAANARQALLIEPQLLDRHLMVADLLFKAADFPAAADTLAEARKLFPSAPRLIYFHALALSQAKKHSEAMEAFEQAEKEAASYQPEMLNADFYFDFGASAEQAGRIDDAVRHFRRSIALDTANAARAYNYLGYMWVDRNENLEEAGELIRRAVELDPTNGAYIDSLGWYFFRTGRYEDALATLLRAAEHLPEPDPVVFDHIADAYMKLGKTSEAVLYWKKALALDPESQTIAAKLDSATDAVAQTPGKPAKEK